MRSATHERKRARERKTERERERKKERERERGDLQKRRLHNELAYMNE